MEYRTSKGVQRAFGDSKGSLLSARSSPFKGFLLKLLAASFISANKFWSNSYVQPCLWLGPLSNGPERGAEITERFSRLTRYSHSVDPPEIWETFKEKVPRCSNTRLFPYGRESNREKKNGERARLVFSVASELVELSAGRRGGRMENAHVLPQISGVGSLRSCKMAKRTTFLTALSLNIA